MHKFQLTIFIFCFIGIAHAQVENPLYKKLIEVTIDKTVPLVSVDSLKSVDYSSFVFLDARETEEFERSRIKNAYWVGYDSFTEECLPKMNFQDTIILYCSIGYRSEKIGEQLVKMGYKHVYNLYGGIFEWINRGLPVYNTSDVKTDSVHGYSPAWGIWLQKGVKVYE